MSTMEEVFTASMPYIRLTTGLTIRIWSIASARETACRFEADNATRGDSSWQYSRSGPIRVSSVLSRIVCVDARSGQVQQVAGIYVDVVVTCTAPLCGTPWGC